MKIKKLIIGITAPQSTMLLEGQLKYFVDKGYKVYLLAPKSEQTIDICEKEGATLLPISIEREISPLKDLQSLFQIIKTLRKVKPDIVNFGTPKVSLLGMIAAKLTGVKKRIYTCRGFRFEHEKGSLKTILIRMERITSRCATRVLCISSSVRKLGMEHKIFSSTKSTIIHKGSSNGIDLNLYNKENLNQKKLQELQLKYASDNKFIFGFLGRIVERKGFKELIEAFDKLYQEDKNIKLLVVGPPFFDQISRETIEIASSHPGIEMVGRVDYEETVYYYSLMDLFVLPAYWEGFGNVLVQAAALEIPILSTRVTGCKDAVSDGFNGMLIEAKNADVLYKSMKTLKNSPELLETYASNGRKWAEHFHPEIIWQGLQKLYLE